MRGGQPIEKCDTTVPLLNQDVYMKREGIDERERGGIYINTYILRRSSPVCEICEYSAPQSDVIGYVNAHEKNCACGERWPDLAESVRN